MVPIICTVTTILHHELGLLYHYKYLTVFQERALNYLSSCIDQVHTFGDILQLVIVELIYKVSPFILRNADHFITL